MTLGQFTEKHLEAPLVHVVLANLLALVTLADDVVERSGKVHARASWQDGFLAEEDFNKQKSKARTSLPV
jgi:hypothetical protein